MKTRLILFILSVYTGIAFCQVAIIAHKDVPMDSITQSQLVDIFTGEINFWSDDQKIIFFDQKTKSAVREKFYEFLGKSSSRMKSIWLKRMLAGEGDPPLALENDTKMLTTVEKTKGAIGFIHSDFANKRVKILFIIK